jgi:hypothetical protein
MHQGNRPLIPGADRKASGTNIPALIGSPGGFYP